MALSNRVSLKKNTGIIHASTQALTSKPLLTVHVILCYLWINLCLQGPASFPLIPLTPDLLLPAWIGPILFCSLTYFAIGILHFHGKSIKHRYRFRVFGIIMLAGAILFCALQQVQNSLEQPQLIAVYTLASLFLGFSTGAMLIELSRIFGSIPPREVLFLGIASAFTTALAVFIIGRLFPLLSWIVFIVLPLPMMWLQEKSALQLKTPPPHKANTTDQAMSIPYRFIFVALVLGFSRGILTGQLIAIPQPALSLINVASLVVVGLFSLICGAVFRFDFKRLIFQAGFLLLGIGFILAGAFSETSAIVILLQLAGFYFLYYNIWALCAYIIQISYQPPVWIVAFPTAALMFAQFVGGMVSSCAHADILQIDGDILIAVMVIAIFLVITFFAEDDKFEIGWGSIKPADSQAEQKSNLSDAVERVSVIYGLTPREVEVTYYLAQNATRKEIHDELLIAVNTVKVHTQNIYRKLNVNAQEELIELVKQHETQEEGGKN